MFQAVRRFFSERDVCEVDCPILSRYAPIDIHIELIQTATRYLHSSPEYPMKRLLSEGMGDIFQLSHVFRAGEEGARHNPEFTMIEWYRLGYTYSRMIEETMDLILLFLPPMPKVFLSYREAVQKYAGFDYLAMTEQQLLEYIRQKQIPAYPGIELEEKDALLNLILATMVEPHLGKDSLLALTHYPASQAALAKREKRGEEAVALRYEIYHRGLELANGYFELTDPREQRARFEEDNASRLKKNKASLPIDEYFLRALESGLPECCGVAVGFDRLMMLRHGESDISSVIPFAWSEI